jgi:hypothetical protein
MKQEVDLWRRLIWQLNRGINLLRRSKRTRVYPKYSGLVPPSIQQLWQREAPVAGRTTMSSEPACQVARSWMDVGSFHKRLFWVVYVTCGVSPEYSGYTLVCRRKPLSVILRWYPKTRSEWVLECWTNYFDREFDIRTVSYLSVWF